MKSNTPPEKPTREFETPLINWFPGHIAKAQKTLKEQLKLVDAVVILVDARLPQGSHFQMINDLLGTKERIVFINKTDLAEPEQTRLWLAWWRDRLNGQAVSGNAEKGEGLRELQQQLGKHTKRLTEKLAARGRLPRPLRVMIVGLPNVGKSSLINRLMKGKKTQVGDKPGVTRHTQWVRLAAGLELLDTPGIIPPKIEDQVIGLKLAMIGSVSQESYEPTVVAREAMKLLNALLPSYLSIPEGEDPLTAFGRDRHFLLPGGHLDEMRAAKTFLQELRSGKLGPLTLERNLK